MRPVERFRFRKSSLFGNDQPSSAMMIDALVMNELDGLPRQASCERLLRICSAGEFRHGPSDRSHDVFDDPGHTLNNFFAELQSESAYAVDGNVRVHFDERK